MNSEPDRFALSGLFRSAFEEGASLDHAPKFFPHRLLNQGPEASDEYVGRQAGVLPIKVVRIFQARPRSRSAWRCLGLGGTRF
jgi:hypothetical protein